jgi:hypothetical protein
LINNNCYLFRRKKRKKKGDGAPARNALARSLVERPVAIPGHARMPCSLGHRALWALRYWAYGLTLGVRFLEAIAPCHRSINRLDRIAIDLAAAVVHQRAKHVGFDENLARAYKRA